MPNSQVHIDFPVDIFMLPTLSPPPSNLPLSGESAPFFPFSALACALKGIWMTCLPGYNNWNEFTLTQIPDQTDLSMVKACNSSWVIKGLCLDL